MLSFTKSRLAGKNLFLLIALFLFAANPVLSQVTIHVPGDYSTIQAGINAAQNGDMVLVDDGTYIENINFSGKAITVASNFIIDGDTNHINNTIIDGSQPSHPDSGSVVSFVSGEDTTSILCGLTITGGTGTYYTAPDRRSGGGINCNFSGARICHNKIIYNTITFNSGIVGGGGINVGPPGNTSWLILENNVISNNSILGNGGGGGGIAVLGNVKLLNNLIEYNIAESIGNMIWGGGIWLFTNNIITNYEWFVIDNIVRYNKAIAPSGTGNNGGVGGGLAITGESHSVIVRNNEITYNEVQGNNPIPDCHGGGVILQNQNESCIFSENYVAHNKALGNSFCKGAGISIWSFNAIVEPRLYNNIIVNNTNGTIGGGIFIGGSGTYTNKPVLINNTISLLSR